MQHCDNLLLSIKVTDSMSRVPRSIQEFARWKGVFAHPICIGWNLSHPVGAELRNWLLLFSVPILREVLPSTYLNQLVVAIHLFSSKQNLRLGRCLLHEFHAEFSDLYGTHIHCLRLNS